MDLGLVGIWSAPLRRGDAGAASAAARVIESLGFGTAWLPGGEDGLAERLGDLLVSTSRLTIATGIVNIWTHPPAYAAELHSRGGGRVLLGLGVGHAPLVDALRPGTYRRPLSALSQYIDELESASPPVPRNQRLVAAFGPRMLDFARERSLGAHPYLVTPEHTRWARGRLGPVALLAPEQHVVMDTNADRARALAREYLSTYWSLPNYVANFRRMGFGEADFARGGSDRMVDELVAWGGREEITQRLQSHLNAGADHVAVQVLVPGKAGFPFLAWEELAAWSGDLHSRREALDAVVR